METFKTIVEIVKVLAWPIVAGIAIYLFKEEIRLLLKKPWKAQLPGGISVETLPERLEAAKDRAVNVEKEVETRLKDKNIERTSIASEDVNKMLIERGLEPSPSGLSLKYYERLIADDPNLGMAALRIDIEKMLRNLAKGFKIELKVSEQSTAGLTRALLRANALTENQFNLLRQVLEICNAAVHGLAITSPDAYAVLEIVKILRDDFVAWLDWGFRK